MEIKKNKFKPTGNQPVAVVNLIRGIEKGKVDCEP